MKSLRERLDDEISLQTDAPSPFLLRKRELGSKNFNTIKWRRPIEENRIASIRIVGTLPVIFSSRAAATAMDIDNNECDFLLAGSAKGSIDVLNLRYVDSRPPNDKPAISAANSHTHMINAIQWFPGDISFFAAASQDQTVKIYDLDRQKSHLKYNIDNPKQLHWNEIDKQPLIAVSDQTSNIILIDCRTSNYHHNVRNKTPVSAIRWFPSERLLCSADERGGLWYWDIRNSMKPLRRKALCNGAIAAVRFTSDGKYVVCVDACRHQIYILESFTFNIIAKCNIVNEKIERVHPNVRNLCLVEEGKYLRIAIPTIYEKLAWIAVDLEKRTIISVQLLSGHMNTDQQEDTSPPSPVEEEADSIDSNAMDISFHPPIVADMEEVEDELDRIQRLVDEENERMSLIMLQELEEAYQDDICYIGERCEELWEQMNAGLLEILEEEAAYKELGVRNRQDEEESLPMEIDDDVDYIVEVPKEK